MKQYDDDPDETHGRAIYRAKANALVRRQIAYASRKIKLKADASKENGRDPT